MTLTTAPKSPMIGARRFGYVVALLVNAALLFAVNTWPGWDVLPFLTDDTPRVLDAVNASIVVSLAANVVYLAQDMPWLKALGDMVTAAVALFAMLQVWQVFPLEFDGESIDWALIARIMLALAILGTFIAIITRFVTFLRDLGRSG